jgi:hypothetical protein
MISQNSLYSYVLTVNWRQGGMRCRKHCENRHRQYSPAFEAGDEIAIAVLKDVVIALQTEVIQALHIARAVESSVLDFTSLHESSVTNCRDATRAMDQLCQRIIASMQFQPQRRVNTSGAPSDSSMRSGFASMGLSDIVESYDLPPSPPPSVGSSQQHYYQRALPPLPPQPQRTSTISRPSDILSQRGRHNTPQASPKGWLARRTISQVNPTNEEQQINKSPEDIDLERRSQLSIQSSALESNRGSVYTQSANTTSTSYPRYLEDPPTKDQATYEQPRQLSQQWTEQPQQQLQQWTEQSQQLSQQWNEQPRQLSQQWTEQPQQRLQQWTASADEKITLASRSPEQNDGYTFGKLALPTPAAEASAFLSQTTRLPRIETAQEHMRALEAPEVLVAPSMPLRPDLSSEKYPAFRTQSDFEDLLKALPVGMDNIWQPLTRPAMHNIMASAKGHGKFGKRYTRASKSR